MRLSQGILRQDGTLMMSIQDLAELTESELRQEDGVTVFGYRMKEGAVVLENKQTAMLVSGAVYDSLGRKIPLDSKILRQDGEIYLPARIMANALGYTVKWSRTDGVETFSVERPVMPRITLDVAYDKEEQRVTGTIRNREPQGFTFGEDFTLERMTAEGWERMREAEPRDINAIGYGMNSFWKGLSDGESPYARRLFCALPAGKYRIGVPFSFTYRGSVTEEELLDVMGEVFEPFTAEGIGRLREEERAALREAAGENLWLEGAWQFYYATQWGKAAFDHAGKDTDTAHEMRSEYILYGEFEVK